MTQKIITTLKSKPYRYIFIFLVPIFLVFFIIIFSIIAGGSQQFSDLAQAFIHGHLNFLAPIGGKGQDPVLYHGRIYWDEGPFPAILLMPFVWFLNLFHHFFYQGYLQWVLVVGTLFFIYKLARILAFSQEDSLFLSLAFALGSVFFGVSVVSSSWFFAQVLTTFLIFWSLYEFYAHKRWWLIGIICGLIFLTRATAAPIIVFFGLELISHKSILMTKIKKLTVLFFPVVLAVIIQGLYNFIRFHNPFNGGYEYQLISSDSAEARSMGIFSIKHLPTNLYSLLFRAPIPVLKDNTSWSLKFPYIENNIYGMSIFLNSPYLLSIFTNKWSKFDRQSRNLTVAILIIALLVLCYYGIGVQEFGYRYALDFLPETFLLFMIMYRKNHDKITFGMKSLIIGSAILNFYLLLSFV